MQTVVKGDPEVEAARAKARAGLDGFLARAASPAPGDRNFALKIPISGNGHVEHVWISAFRERDGRFTGRLDNAPRDITTYKSGQSVSFARAEIGDWMYREGDVIRGNFIACALIARRSAADREKMASLGLRCEA